MIAQVSVDDEYLFVTCTIVDNEGTPFDPFTIYSTIYRVSKTDGSLVKQTQFGDGGQILLGKQDNVVGFYGSTINISGLPAGMYIVTTSATHNNESTVYSDTFVIEKAGGISSSVPPSLG